MFFGKEISDKSLILEWRSRTDGLSGYEQRISGGTLMKMQALVVLSILSAILLAACAGGDVPPADKAEPAPGASEIPPAVNGWREYPLRDGVISIKPAKWRTDTIEVPVPMGKALEYKLTMQKGDTIVYHVTFGGLADPGQMTSEFHGHTEQVNGVGDLMFYAKTGGSPQSGAFTAPWDGIHGWYLKNDSTADVVVKLELAGFYELAGK
jgi:hypothetical protein